jgi:hypothetical protein
LGGFGGKGREYEGILLVNCVSLFFLRREGEGRKYKPIFASPNWGEFGGEVR